MCLLYIDVLLNSEAVRQLHLLPTCVRTFCQCSLPLKRRRESRSDCTGVCVCVCVCVYCGNTGHDSACVQACRWVWAWVWCGWVWWVCKSICLPVCLSVSPTLSLCFCPSVSVSLCLIVCLCVSLQSSCSFTLYLIHTVCLSAIPLCRKYSTCWLRGVCILWTQTVYSTASHTSSPSSW